MEIGKGEKQRQVMLATVYKKPVFGHRGCSVESMAICTSEQSMGRERNLCAGSFQAIVLMGVLTAIIILNVRMKGAYVTHACARTHTHTDSSR